MRFALLIIVLWTAGCASIAPSTAIKAPTIQAIKPISNYSMAVINDAPPIQSAIATKDGAFTRTFDPDDAIAGILLKKGVSRVYDAPMILRDKILLVSWGISGSRNIGALGAYSQEVTILIRQMDNLDIVYKCTAEGIGTTEADDVREAVNSCLSGI
jgi:hypothetical protein